MNDKVIEKAIKDERERQLNGIELIASENYVSNDVSEAMGSVLTNKYAEGYPSHRYYGGCEVIDRVENTAINRVCELFGVKYANVQPHSGSQANRAVIESVCNMGDTILSLDLNHGGHLTHGSPVSFSGKYYNIISYGCKKDGYIDYEDLIEKARTYKPKLIIAGASAYSREWNYEALQKAAQVSDAVLMFDMAHTAGLIAAGLLKNPCNYCDIVTSTTHKTLRGPRGGIILMKNDFTNPKGLKDNKGNVKMMSQVINSEVFPGNQGGPLENIIAAKAVCFKEAMSKEFRMYQERVIENAKSLCEALKEHGFKIISDGTDNHCFLIDLREKYPEMTGKQAEFALGIVGITVNKNMIPFDTRTPFTTSGLRIGTPAITTRGFNKLDMKLIADLICATLDAAYNSDEKMFRIIQRSVHDFCKQHPYLTEEETIDWID